MKSFLLSTFYFLTYEFFSFCFALDLPSVSVFWAQCSMFLSKVLTCLVFYSEEFTTACLWCTGVVVVVIKVCSYL